jgi:hypothetical protein
VLFKREFHPCKLAPTTPYLQLLVHERPSHLPGLGF